MKSFRIIFFSVVGILFFALLFHSNIVLASEEVYYDFNYVSNFNDATCIGQIVSSTGYCFVPSNINLADDCPVSSSSYYYSTSTDFFPTSFEFKMIFCGEGEDACVHSPTGTTTYSVIITNASQTITLAYGTQTQDYVGTSGTITIANDFTYSSVIPSGTHIQIGIGADKKGCINDPIAYPSCPGGFRLLKAIQGTNEYGYSVSYGGVYIGTEEENPLEFALTYPSSTTSQIPEFSTWVLDIGGDYSQLNGYFGVHYGLSSSSFSFSDTCSIINGISYCLTQDNDYLLIPKSQILSSLSSDTWYAQSYFFNSDSMEFLYGDIVSFQVGNYYAPSNVDVSLLSYANSYDSDLIISEATTTCAHPTSSFFDAPGDNLAYAGCVVVDFMFRPHTNFTSYITNGFNNFKQRFPFSIFFSTLDNITNAVSSSADNSYDLYLDMPFSDVKIPILTSSTLTNAVGSSTKEYIFSTESAVIWVLASVAVLFMIIGII